jgi:multidrug efflux pump subunit AcrA (membrane-fusion protein)
MASNASGKMTVFKTDRHEDVAAMGFVGVVVAAILVYMAYIVPSVTITPGLDGKIVAMKVQPDQVVAKGDPLYVIRYKDRKFVGGQLQEKFVEKDVHAATGGKVLSVSAKEGSDVKKGKTALLVLSHQKGTLP